jgi:membrane protein DedA with SNARE-associated domain
MNLESFVQTYGYLAVLVGTFLEGETILVLAGFAAHQGYMKLPWVILAVFVGSLSGDQLFFFLGRRRGQTLLVKHPTWQVRVEKIHKRLDSYGIPFMLGFRFLYGLRTVSPFVIGISPVPTRLFIFLNAGGAIVWAVAFGAGGYLFGHAMQIVIGDIQHYEREASIGIAITGLLIWIINFYRRKLQRSEYPESSQIR